MMATHLCNVPAGKNEFCCRTGHDFNLNIVGNIAALDAELSAAKRARCELDVVDVELRCLNAQDQFKCNGLTFQLKRNRARLSIF